MSYRWIFFLPFVFLFPISASAQTNGNVAAGTTLSAGEKSKPWLSPSGDFAFGFKQLQEKDQFLFSIWFDKIPDKTVAWYPNTINPVVARGSSIRVDSNAGLVLLDPQKKELWRAEGIDTGSGGTNQGFMNDTGNFILKGNDGSWLWQSFQVYADTMLPGQILDVGSALNSRQSETNFTNGRFYLRFRDDGNLVLTSKVVAQNSDDGAVYYSSLTSYADNSSNSGYLAVFDSRGSIYVLTKNNQKEQLSPVSADVSGRYLRATLEFDGVFVLYSHPRSFSGTNPAWDVLWSVPDNICTDLKDGDNKGACGYNSICSIVLVNKRPVCNCPKGYTLADPNSKYGDCNPDFTPTCDKQQKSEVVMLQETDVDWPLSDYLHINPATETVCNQSCFEDCFCAVSIFRSGQCWKKKLPLSNGKRDTSLGSTAFIKSGLVYFAPPPPINTDSKSKEKGPISVVLGSVLLGCSLFVLALIAALFFASYLMYRKSKGKNKASAVETTLYCFTFKELEEATSDFRDELGSGSFGVVYKGELAIRSRSVHVAVKKLDRLSQEKEFRAEVNSIGQTNHKNLVRLLGFCDEGKHRLLVYEYMSNGSLAGFLFSENKPSWNMRKHIAIGVARGLVYLHEECSIQIIHCDIKPQNILLDDYYKVRISDFGLAKLLDITQSKVSMTNVRGTKGYVAPEMFTSNQVTAKIDVYSFGVVLLEIISCRRCLQGMESSEEDWYPLTDLVWDCFEGKRLDKVVGNDSEALNDIAMVERFVMVGLWCIQENASLRPTMRKVSQMLEGILEIQIPPSPPTFSTTKDLSHVSMVDYA